MYSQTVSKPMVHSSTPAIGMSSSPKLTRLVNLHLCLVIWVQAGIIFLWGSLTGLSVLTWETWIVFGWVCFFCSSLGLLLLLDASFWASYSFSWLSPYCWRVEMLSHPLVPSMVPMLDTKQRRRRRRRVRAARFLLWGMMPRLIFDKS